MDPWKEFSAWEAGREKVRRWAALEGKSATMSDDLYRGRLARARCRRKALGILGFCVHAGVWVLEVWRFMRSG
jgi:hypothetical protein